MELLKTHKRRTLLSEIIYILLNIGLAVAVLALVIATGTPWLALAFVILSKWRVFAVRPRFWFAHIESNAVDTIVSISLVVLIFLASGNVIVQASLAVFYALWLLVLKPATKRNSIAIQAAIAIVLGSIALTSTAYEWHSSVYVLLMWIIGYAAARHVLVAYSEDEVRFLSLVWAFVFALLSWVTYHWTISYSLPYASGLKLPQIFLFLIGISFLAERAYNSHHKHGNVRIPEIILPLAFTVVIITVILLYFNVPPRGAI